MIDADPLFQTSGRFNPQAVKRGFETRKPWYRLLANECAQITYVEECLLQPDKSQQTINNPNVSDYLVHYKGHYRSNMVCH